MNKDEVGDKVAYTSVLEQAREELGQEVFEIADMLAHGLTKRRVAKILNIPYPELKKKVLLLKKFLSQEYYVGGNNGGKKGSRKTKKSRSK